jgi:RNA polymerase sigma-70 factor (ECF subfamily)
MMPMDGSELMLRFVEGDDQAFEELLKMYAQEALNYFFRMTRERHLAEDMTQELFLKVYKYRKSYRPSSGFKYFLFRIARNMWIDHFRKRKSGPAFFTLQGPVGRGGERRDSWADRKSEDEPPQEQAIRKEQVHRLEEAVARLPAKQREVIALALEGGLKYAEIAQIAGVPVGTIKSRMHAAVTQLRKWLGKEFKA